MILQTDSRLREEIQTDGCYYMSILFLVNKYTGLKMSAEFIDSVFDVLVALGYMSEQCYVLDPEEMFRHLGLRVKYTDQHESPSKVCNPGQIEILYFMGPVGGHFTAGNGTGIVTYDPWGVSRAVSEGKLISKRIFRRL